MRRELRRTLLFSVAILIAVVISGCRTKKVAISSIGVTHTDSSRIELQEVRTNITVVDTTAIDENTTLIREYVFGVDSLATFDSLSLSPMVTMLADGSISIHHGLKKLIERKQAIKSERRHVNTKSGNDTSVRSKTRVRHKGEARNKVSETTYSDTMWPIYIGLVVLFLLFILTKYGKL